MYCREPLHCIVRGGSPFELGLGCAQVNGKLQTSNPNIYAVGDVAAFPLHSYGLNKMFRQEHVQNCRESAKHAGVTAESSEAPFAVIPAHLVRGSSCTGVCQWLDRGYLSNHVCYNLLRPVLSLSKDCSSDTSQCILFSNLQLTCMSLRISSSPPGIGPDHPC